MLWTSNLYLLIITLFTLVLLAKSNKLICYYDAESINRDGPAKMRVSDIEPAIQSCDFLLFYYAETDVDSSKWLTLPSKNVSSSATFDKYLPMTEIKRKYPFLKVLLSFGGGSENQDADKYISLLESQEKRTAFINSAHIFVKSYGIDGLDLAWRFYETKPKKIRGTLGSIWKSVKKTFGTTKVDNKEQEHKEQFTSFVREMKNAFRPDNLLLTATVLPNVNSTVYFDVRYVIPNLDQVHLHAFDFYKPERNPQEADYPAPMYELIDRKPDENVNYIVQYWINNGAPSTKLILGFPTYGRTWKITSDSGTSGVPPLSADGPGNEGPYTKTAGLLSYPEICMKVQSPTNAKGNAPQSKKVPDSTNRRVEHTRVTNDDFIHDDSITKRYGVYAFRLPDANGENGLWMGYEDPDTAATKTAYAKAKSLGGVAIVDLSHDDFRGLCTGDPYPILRAVKNRL